jgi:nitrite reductase/ring-hydroxylating ferredoxin subunit
VEWIKVFASNDQTTSSLAVDKPRLLLIGGKRICIVRTADHVLAVDDKCTHNGESLSKGSVNYLGELVCPWHGHRFDLKTGRECGQRSEDLVVYPVLQNEEGLFVGI